MTGWMHGDTIRDKIYNILEVRKEGVSLQGLARMLDLKIGTVKKRIAIMEDELLVVRTTRGDKYVYVLTGDDNMELWRR